MHMRLLIKSNKGSSLLMVLIVMVVVIIFSITMLTIGSASIRQAQNQELKLQAYYLARSGAHAVASYIVENPDGLSDSARSAFVSNLVLSSPSEPFKLSPDDDGDIRVSVTRPSNELIVVSATGEKEGVTQTVSVDIHVEEAAGVELTKAAYSLGNITMSNGTITGDVFINSNISFDGGARIEGELYIMPDSDISAPHWKTDAYYGTPKIQAEYPSFPIINFPDYPAKPNIQNKKDNLIVTTSAEINSDTHFTGKISVSQSGKLTIKKPTNRVIYANSFEFSGGGTVNDEGPGSLFLYIENDLTVSSNRTITLNIGDEDTNIVVGKLSLNGHIVAKRAEGKKGRLNIYIKDEFSMNGTISFIGQDEEVGRAINIYYGGTKPLTFYNVATIPGLLHVKQAELVLSSSSRVTGTIITGGPKVTLTGGTNLTLDMIYAPNAVVDFNNGTVRGCIISQSLSISGGARLYYKPLNTEYEEWTGGSSDKTSYTIEKWY